MRALVVGLGGIGQRHVRNLRRLCGTGVDITAYRSRKLSHVLTEGFEIEPDSDLETKYDIHADDDLEHALAQRPDAVFICNPTSLHLPVAQAAAQNGCHLFIEKPLAHCWEGIEDLLRTVDSHGRVALVGYQLRFHPCLRRLRELLDERAIGRILTVSAEVGEYLPDWHPFEDYREMYASRRSLGGGVILSQIHELDYVYWLFGLPRRVFAVGGHLSSLDIDVEDTASILMECNVDGRNIPVRVHQDYLRRPPTRTCEVVGEEGLIRLDFRRLWVRHWDHEGQLTNTYSYEGHQRNDLFVDELRHFLACIRREEAPAVTLRDGAQSVRMALAARESMETGRVVELL
jgi:predicted dehydrogenase